MLLFIYFFFFWIIFVQLKIGVKKRVLFDCSYLLSLYFFSSKRDHVFFLIVYYKKKILYSCFMMSFFLVPALESVYFWFFSKVVSCFLYWKCEAYSPFRNPGFRKIFQKCLLTVINFGHGEMPGGWKYFFFFFELFLEKILSILLKLFSIFWLEKIWRTWKNVLFHFF